jgi:hypothetical protein
MTNAEASFGAIGPSHVDPRSGEILDADIGFESLSSRNIRNLRSQVLVGGPAAMAALMQPGGQEAGAALATGADAASAWPQRRSGGRAAVPTRSMCWRRAATSNPTRPEAQQFVLDYLKDVTMHEVGHTLGLRHNFRARAFHDEPSCPTPSSRASTAPRAR